MMTTYQLHDIDPEDIEDLLVKVEALFGIRFVGDELARIKTFGQLCDHIAGKIQLIHPGNINTEEIEKTLIESSAKSI